MLYRGLKMEIEELNVLKQNEVNLISTNGFLFTSRSKDVAMKFALRPTKRTDLVTVLYEIECNVSEVESVVFADITKYSEFVSEKEVLFDLGSTFKILSVSEDKTLNLHVIKIEATDAGMQTAKTYIELNRKDHEEASLIIMFGKLLIQMGRYDEALKYFKNLLNDSSPEKDIARIYNEIGSAHMFKGELNEAYKNFQRAYEMMMNVQPRRVKDSARPLTNIASIFLRKGEYEKALDFYIQALEIRQKFYGRNHLYTAISLNNIGNVYYKKENYYQALMYHQTALKIRQNNLPNDHLDIAASFNNIGLIYWKRNDFNRAQNYYEKSLEIRKKLLPSDHNEIAQSLINIACVLYDQGQLDNALKYYSEALIIQKIHFDPNDHDDLVNRINEHRHRQNHGDVLLVEYTKQASSVTSERTYQEPRFIWPEFETQLDSVEEVTRTSVNNASPIHDIIQALINGTHYQIAFQLWQQKLHKYEEFDENHSYVQGLLWIMGDTITNFYPSDANGEEVVRFYEKALFILANSVPQIIDTDNISILCLDRLGSIHQRNKNFQLAFDYFTRELKIQQQLENPNSQIAITLRNIGIAYMNLGDYNLALTSFNDALKLFQSNSTDPNNEEVSLTLKRIDETKEALQLAIHS
jgi:tetratricopeptide (TPR) repeat protein